MPIFAVTYTYADRPVVLDEHRPAHRAFLRGLLDAGTLLASGPLAQDAANPAGALLLVDAPDEATVTTTLDADPFARENVITRRAVRPWSPVIGPWADRA
ncbi:YciI family protein [Oerskovia turbata]